MKTLSNEIIARYEHERRSQRDTAPVAKPRMRRRLAWSVGTALHALAALGHLASVQND